MVVGLLGSWFTAMLRLDRYGCVTVMPLLYAISAEVRMRVMDAVFILAGGALIYLADADIIYWWLPLLLLPVFIIYLWWKKKS